MKSHTRALFFVIKRAVDEMSFNFVQQKLNLQVANLPEFFFQQTDKVFIMYYIMWQNYVDISTK